MDASPSVRLQRLIEIAQEHDPDLALWLHGGIARWRNGTSLDAALGLQSSDMRRARDLALREAARCIDPDGGMPRWAVAGLLASALRSFESTTWLRYKDAAEQPTLSPLKQALWAAFRSGARPIRSQRKLFEIL